MLLHWAHHLATATPRVTLLLTNHFPANPPGDIHPGGQLTLSNTVKARWGKLAPDLLGSVGLELARAEELLTGPHGMRGGSN